MLFLVLQGFVGLWLASAPPQWSLVGHCSIGRGAVSLGKRGMVGQRPHHSLYIVLNCSKKSFF